MENGCNETIGLYSYQPIGSHAHWPSGDSDQRTKWSRQQPEQRWFSVIPCRQIALMASTNGTALMVVELASAFTTWVFRRKRGARSVEQAISAFISTVVTFAKSAREGGFASTTVRSTTAKSAAELGSASMACGKPVVQRARLSRTSDVSTEVSSAAASTATHLPKQLASVRRISKLMIFAWISQRRSCDLSHRRGR